MGHVVSVIIPSRNDRYLADTLESVYASHANFGDTELEAVVVLDGPSNFEVPAYPNLTILHNARPAGIRPSINRAVAASHGDYLLKLDAHCIVGPNFINTLLEDMQDDWVSVASRYTLDLETLEARPRRVDYYYLSCPWTHPVAFMMQSCPWIRKTEAWADKPVDDLLCFQGSMWLMSRAHWDWLGGLGEDMDFCEHHEISFKTWYGGRRVVINKNAWYAHPNRPTGGYRMDMQTVYADHDDSASRWIFLHKKEFEALIDRFWPFPFENNRHRAEKYFWPEDWKKFL